MRTKLYVGRIANKPSVVFRSATTPTFESHGSLYNCVIGPFRTRRGADWMADPQKGQNNPHCRCVADAERLASKYAGA
jgi:hypothetical protein